MDPVGMGGVGGLFVSRVCVGEGVIWRALAIFCTKGLRPAATVAVVYKYIHIHNSFFSAAAEGKFSRQCVDQ